MNRFKTIIWAVAVAAMALATSCLSGDDNQTTTERISPAMAFMVDRVTGQTVSEQSTSMEITIDYAALTMDLAITNLTLPDGKSMPKITFSDLPLKSNSSGWIIAEGTNVYPTAEGFAQEMMPLFSSVRIGSINHFATIPSTNTPDGLAVAGYERAVRLEISNYVIYLTSPSSWSTGITKVTDLGNSADSFSSTKPVYLINLDTERHTANITVHNAVFAQPMESLGLVIEFRDVPYTVDANGNIRMVRTETFDPYHDKAPNANFPISDLKCTWNIFNGIDISFNCSAMGSSYYVAASMPFNYGINSGSTQQ